jgi:hypothetical protein
MAKFKPPKLTDVTKAYLDLQDQPARMKDFESLEKQFQKALTRAKTPDEIRAALRLDSGRKLPVQLKSPLYERLLVLQGRSISLLREYAQIMYEFGPAFQQYADRLWDEADLLEEADEAI